MTLDGRLLYLSCFIAVGFSSALDIPELSDLDQSLNPQLIGAVFTLYNHKPALKPLKKIPIVVDCDHPDVVCKFGTSVVVKTLSDECDCKTADNVFPLIGESTAQKEKNNGKDGDISTKSGGKEPEVPIFKGVINTEAILNEANRPYGIWNFQRNSIEKGGRPSDDPSKPRIGEIPTKFYSYYPFDKPPSTNDFIDDSPPSMMGPPNFIPWTKPLLQSPIAFPSNNRRPPPTFQSTKSTTSKPFSA